MARKILFFVLIIIIVSTIYFGFKSLPLFHSTETSMPSCSGQFGEPSQSCLHPEEEILNSTLRIIMFFPIMDMEENNQVDASESQTSAPQIGRYIAGNGLGTVVDHAGHSLIITHDHWQHPMSELALVEFRDVENGLLLELDGQLFCQLIRHQDGGTMIIETPLELKQTNTDISLDLPGNGRALSVGDVVQLTHQVSGDGSEIAILEARVESIIIEQGIPAYNLRTLDGHPIIHGDSGGGMWLNGQLVGNLWSTQIQTGWKLFGIWSIKFDPNTTDMCTAAGLPIGFLNHAGVD